MKLAVADVLLVIHFAWAIWMISGVALAVGGFIRPRFWCWRWFRITHLAGLLGTASVPFWADGICPFTRWEWTLRSGAPTSSRSFIICWIERFLYVDVDPIVLSLVTGLGAVATLAIFVSRPPWRTARILRGK